MELEIFAMVRGDPTTRTGGTGWAEVRTSARVRRSPSAPSLVTQRQPVTRPEGSMPDDEIKATGEWLAWHRAALDLRKRGRQIGAVMLLAVRGGPRGATGAMFRLASD